MLRVPGKNCYHPFFKAMFGSFSEDALLAYAEKVKKVNAKQGTEWSDTVGVGETDSTFLDTDESQDKDDYRECYDFTTCLRLGVRNK